MDLQAKDSFSVFI
ncbi:99c52c07-d6db-42ad-b839-fae886a8e6ba [Thermothielavioides terrestris]|uniref:99c52c07-d6db-42ad-b839-fae886a8e6ba n=1 Tax=Thermothielavioides terrestris TaxID=2587410 RepID=A0A446BQY2_9PEZI|nr:99c52c07-d6db-42ad-b839-fae886a8e6ba [Thermothielavioides terrestris]